MSNTSPADYIVDRRLLQRKLSFWRVVSILLLIAGLVFIGLRVSGRSSLGLASLHIARITISGVITGDRATLKLINDVAESKNTAGVILAIDSPGGTTTGAEKLFIALRRLAAKKPTVAVVGTMAASGAYIAAIGADHIVAPGNALVGSIGVLFEYPDLSGLLGKVGVKMDSVKSSPLKAEPSGYEPTSPEVRAALASLVADSFTWFKGLVKDRRGMTDAQLATVDDGRVFTGRQGIGLKLIDEVGEEREGVAWLERVKKVPHGLPVRDWTATDRFQRFGIFSSAAKIAEVLGFPGLANVLGGTETYAQGQLLDGLVAIWQAGPAN
ncbi:MAG TPA: signal peptide peptidase SppA [Methylovirgula sp.]